jgi:hypothetical protein
VIRVTLQYEDPELKVIWAEQVSQAKQVGEPNHIERLPGLDCERLHHYDDAGRVRGIFKFYPKEVQHQEKTTKARSFFIIVDPAFQRRELAADCLPGRFESGPSTFASRNTPRKASSS